MRLKLGMVGGGRGAFIGNVHRIASRIDGRWELVAAALSSDPDKAHASACDLGIERSYGSYEEMAVVEAARPDGIDAVAIVTPNHMHAAPAIAFLRAGIHVICDKPLAATPQDAEAIAEAVRQSGKHFILTHNYSGYPLIRQARDMVARGDIGALRLVHVEYAQDWLAEAPAPDNKQADWRTDPARAGGGAIGDIGTHAFQLACFVTGQKVTRLAAELTSFVDGRQVDDNAEVLLRFDGGAKGVLWASQMAVGCENGLRLRIYGSKGGIEWGQENPNMMTYSRLGQPKQIITRGQAGSGQWSRTPAGHPEGYLEAFATLYAEAADLIGGGAAPLLPDINDGLQGMWFISACKESNRHGTTWIDNPSR